MILKSWNTFAYFLKAYPLRGAAMVVALAVAGLLEGIGIAALLPLITILTNSGELGDSKIGTLVSGLFSGLGLTPDIPIILVFIVGIMFLKAVVTMAAITQVAYSSAHVTADLRKTYLQTLLRASWLHYLTIRSGASANALGLESQRAALAFKQGCVALAFVIQILVYAVLAVFVSWKITIAALGAGALLVVILGFLTREARKAGKEQTDVFNRVLSLITEALQAAKPLKSMSKGTSLASMMEDDIRALQSAQRRMDLTDQSIWVLSEPLMLVFIAVGLYAALAFSALPIAELLFLAVLSLRLIMRVASAQRAYQSMAANESALQALKEKIDAADLAREDFSGVRKPGLTESVDVQNVTYAYGDKQVLKGVTMTFPVNRFHLIYGVSGAGKTTLVDLVTGLLQPQAGRVLVDGVPLPELDLVAWRGLIGYVPQDVYLFHDTVFANISLGDPAISREAAESALRNAEAWEFVEAMEQGLDTVVGERGAKLSGGQRQRLALARAIVHNPMLLILDEATSALDTETEKAVLKTIKLLSRQMTILAISHNPALAGSADHVYYLLDGRVENREKFENEFR